MSFLQNIKKAFEKPRASSKATPTLKDEDFSLEVISRIGSTPCPTAMAYDPVQKLLAVASATGVVHVYGRHSLEKRMVCPDKAPILFIYWIVNSGRLVSISKDGNVYRWAVWNDYPPRLIATMACHATAADFPVGSKFLYVGDHLGTVSVCNVEDEHVSAYRIKGEAARGRGDKCRVTALEQNPADDRQMLICYDDGTVVIWDLLMKKTVRAFDAGGGKFPAVTSCSWHGLGQKFVTGHGDGSLRIWRAGKDSPAHTFYVAPATPCSAVTQVEWYGPTASSELGTLFVAGGEQHGGEMMGLSVLKDGGGSIDKKPFESRSFQPVEAGVACFALLSQSPWRRAPRRDPLGVSVVTPRQQALMYNYAHPGSPGITLNHMVQRSLVTAQQFHPVVGKDFLNDLLMTLADWQQSLRAKYWPLGGGRFSRIPSLSLSGSLLVTGHVTGEVRIWDASERGHLPSVFLTSTAALLGLADGEKPPSKLPAVTAVALCPVARILSIGTEAGQLGVFMFRGGEIVSERTPTGENESKKTGGFEMKFRVPGHTAEVTHVQVVSGLYRLVAVDKKSVLSISETMQGMCLLRQAVFEREAVSFVRVVDQEPAVLLYVGGEEGSVMSYDIGSCSPVISVRFPDSTPLISVSVLTPDGKLMAAPSPSEWFDVGEMEALDTRQSERAAAAAEADGSGDPAGPGAIPETGAAEVTEEDEQARDSQPNDPAPVVPPSVDEMAGSERAGLEGGAAEGAGEEEAGAGDGQVADEAAPSTPTPPSASPAPAQEEADGPAGDVACDSEVTKIVEGDGDGDGDGVAPAGAESPPAANDDSTGMGGPGSHLHRMSEDEAAAWLEKNGMGHHAEAVRGVAATSSVFIALTEVWVKADEDERLKLRRLFQPEADPVPMNDENRAGSPRANTEDELDQVMDLSVLSPPKAASPNKHARTFSTSVSPQMVAVVSESLVVVAQLPSVRSFSKFTTEGRVVCAEAVEVSGTPCMIVVDDTGVLTMLQLPALIPITTKDLKSIGVALRGDLLRMTCLSPEGDIVFLSSSGEINIGTLFGSAASNTAPKKFFLDGLEMPERPSAPAQEEGLFKKLFGSQQIAPQIQAEQLEELLGKPSAPAQLNVTPSPPLKAADEAGSSDSQRRKEMQAKTNSTRENLEQAKESLVERGEKLSQLATKTNELSDQADNFLSSIRAYNQRQESKKWWQL